ncbi:hypothetical protein [Clostridium thermobutyricum]|uniref:hypothetical protein n=1 Tax=Clostridium thermobutyricum TaxID=29372 RepID=UPI0018AB75B7|nr:hypothetical protein [Clostridium thermobutyricum]
MQNIKIAIDQKILKFTESEAAFLMDNFNELISKITDIIDSTFRTVYEHDDITVHGIYIPYVVTDEKEFIVHNVDSIIDSTLVKYMIENGNKTFEFISKEESLNYLKKIGSNEVKGLVKIPIALKIIKNHDYITEVRIIDKLNLLERINRCINSVDKSNSIPKKYLKKVGL